MESIITFFADSGIDCVPLFKVSGILLLGSLLISGFLRFIFGKKTLIGNSISSSIAIVYIYVASAAILTLLPKLQWILAPLPFVSFSGDAIHFFSFAGTSYTDVAAQLLAMIILSFLVNLAGRWLPKGKNIISWFFWRCGTVALGIIMHFIVTWLFHHFLPEGIVIYAPVILMAILLIMLLTGALKLVVGAILTTVNPLIAAFYTFFFASAVGKQLTKAILTTGIMTAIVRLLQKFGVISLSLAATAMAAYIPFLLLLLLVWYVITRVF